MTDKQVALIIANYARHLGMAIDPLLELSTKLVGLLDDNPTLKVTFESLLIEFTNNLNKIASGMQVDAMMLSNPESGYNYDNNKS